jgi:tRNA threonylcarbamoyladenosine biosynthesis protein TsaB
MEAKYLLIETSVTLGKVGLAEGPRVLAETNLNIQHRHNRDLAPAVAALLQHAGWLPGEIDGVIVSRGPGSYTGLRVGIMSAKAFAYAAGCRLIPVDTFRCVARQAPLEIGLLDVIADAQQGHVYSQTFARELPPGNRLAASDLAIELLTSWLARRQALAWASGPGVVTLAKQLTGSTHLVAAELCHPTLDSLLQEAIERGTPLGKNELLTFEPLYLRPSSAEEKWAKLGK